MLSDFSPEPECENGSVRMVQTNDEESSFSAVQLCIHGFWAFIGGNFWDDTDASVVCRELGFLSFSKENLIENSV